MRIRTLLTVAAWCFVAWCVCTTMLAAVMAAIADARGVVVSWEDTLSPSLAYSTTWLLVLPLMILAARRLPIEARGTRWRMPIAIALRPVLAAITTALQLMLHYVLTDVGVLPTISTAFWPEGGTMFFVGRFYEGALFALLVLIGDALRMRSRTEHARQLRDAHMASQLAEARLAALSMELQPHFLFNTLNAISTLVHSDPDAADRMIARLSTLLRRTLETGRQPMASVADELTLLGLYLDIQRIRFGDRLTVIIDVPDHVQDAQVPPLLLQPIVENAIQHGLTPQRGPVRLEVLAHRERDNLLFTVRDDGVGLSPTLKEGTGMSNTRSRLAQLYPNRHRVSLSARPARGAQVVISIPFEESHA